MGIVGPMGAYGAANDTDLTQHLVAELRKAMEAKSAAQRDANGNKYVPVDYFVVWQTVELLWNGRLLADRPAARQGYHGRSLDILRCIANEVQGGIQRHFISKLRKL